MAKKLTYTKKDLNQMLLKIPYISFPEELLTQAQLERKKQKIEELEAAIRIYQIETGE